MKNKTKITVVLGVMCFALTAGICIQIKTVKNTNSTVTQNYTENNLRAEVLKYKEKYDNLMQEMDKLDIELENHIIRIFKESKNNYGSRKIKAPSGLEGAVGQSSITWRRHSILCTGTRRSGSSPRLPHKTCCSVCCGPDPSVPRPARARTLRCRVPNQQGCSAPVLPAAYSRAMHWARCPKHCSWCPASAVFREDCG